MQILMLFWLQADTEELSGTEEHENAKEILETTVLEN